MPGRTRPGQAPALQGDDGRPGWRRAKLCDSCLQATPLWPSVIPVVKIFYCLRPKASPGYQHVVALNETIRLMAETNQVIDAYGGWPDAFLTK